MDVSLIEEVELSEEEKQMRSMRQKFLMSGVPQKLKKHLTTENGTFISEHAPLPRFSHVQQVS